MAKLAALFELRKSFESNVAIMKRHFNSRFITRSIRAFFGTKRHVTAIERHPDIYFKHIYFEKRLYEGIRWLAGVRHVPVMQQANEPMAKAFANEMEELVDKAANLQLAERYLEQNRELVRFIMALRKLAKEKGVNIDSLIPPQRTRPFTLTD